MTDGVSGCEFNDGGVDEVVRPLPVEVSVELVPGALTRMDPCVGDVPVLEVVTGQARVTITVDVDKVSALGDEHVALVQTFADAACGLRDEVRELVDARRKVSDVATGQTRLATVEVSKVNVLDDGHVALVGVLADALCGLRDELRGLVGTRGGASGQVDGTTVRMTQYGAGVGSSTGLGLTGERGYQ
jgi:hypothetical protein